MLEFAKNAEQEDPIISYSSTDSREEVQTQMLNRRIYRARMTRDFTRDLGGPLVSITKEFKSKGISPNFTMQQPPASPAEISIGGEALCGMVYELRAREGIPEPHRDARTISDPCEGTIAIDDPFPT
jgi:hypothetical protein